MINSKSTLKTNFKNDMGSIVCSALFILIGFICFLETMEMSDPDSFVFPRMVIAGLVGLSLVHIITALFKPKEASDDVEAETSAKPSTPRRVLLVVAMLSSALLMPRIGFLLAGLITFLALMLMSEFYPWTRKKLLTYSVVVIVIVFGFYGAFSTILNVPLPEGSWLQVP